MEAYGSFTTLPRSMPPWETAPDNAVNLGRNQLTFLQRVSHIISFFTSDTQFCHRVAEDMLMNRRPDLDSVLLTPN